MTQKFKYYVTLAYLDTSEDDIKLNTLKIKLTTLKTR